MGCRRGIGLVAAVCLLTTACGGGGPIATTEPPPDAREEESPAAAQEQARPEPGEVVTFDPTDLQVQGVDRGVLTWFGVLDSDDFLREFREPDTSPGTVALDACERAAPGYLVMRGHYAPPDGAENPSTTVLSATVTRGDMGQGIGGAATFSGAGDFALTVGSPMWLVSMRDGMGQQLLEHSREKLRQTVDGQWLQDPFTGAERCRISLPGGVASEWVDVVDVPRAPLPTAPEASLERLAQQVDSTDPAAPLRFLAQVVGAALILPHPQVVLPTSDATGALLSLRQLDAGGCSHLISEWEQVRIEQVGGCPVREPDAEPSSTLQGRTFASRAVAGYLVHVSGRDPARVREVADSLEALEHLARQFLLGSEDSASTVDPAHPPRDAGPAVTDACDHDRDDPSEDPELQSVSDQPFLGEACVTVGATRYELGWFVPNTNVVEAEDPSVYECIGIWGGPGAGFECFGAGQELATGVTRSDDAGAFTLRTWLVPKDTLGLAVVMSSGRQIDTTPAGRIAAMVHRADEEVLEVVAVDADGDRRPLVEE